VDATNAEVTIAEDGSAIRAIPGQADEAAIYRVQGDTLCVQLGETPETCGAVYRLGRNEYVPVGPENVVGEPFEVTQAVEAALAAVPRHVNARILAGVWEIDSVSTADLITGEAMPAPEGEPSGHDLEGFAMFSPGGYMMLAVEPEGSAPEAEGGLLRAGTFTIRGGPSPQGTRAIAELDLANPIPPEGPTLDLRLAIQDDILFFRVVHADAITTYTFFKVE
jgi:hypothetical protein